MTGKLAINLLGAPQVQIDNKAVTGFVSSKAEALVYYLAATGKKHRRVVLAGLLWSEVPERTSRRNLRDVLSNLRQHLGDYLHINRKEVGLMAGLSIEVDSQAFSRIAENFRKSGKPPSQTTTAELDLLEEALKLYKGDFLSGFYITKAPEFEQWCMDERYRLQREHEEILEQVVEVYAARGDYRSAIGYAKNWLATDPLRESAHRELMCLYVWDGDRAGALKQYRECSEVLLSDLGVDPSLKTRRLYEQILEGEPIEEEFSVRGYELGDIIGKGSVGAVYCARQLFTDREVAIKTIRPKFANQLEFIRRFENEAHIIARLEHPYIVPLYDFWREPGGAFLVMRWMRSGSLQKSLENGAWKIEPSIKLIGQISEALASAHRRGVVHRDIKPANILLDEEGNAYLSDFGIAKDFQNIEYVEEGPEEPSSPAYSSPEQLLGEEVSTKSDIYSLGLVIYEMLTGKLPFSDFSFDEIRKKQITEPLPSLLGGDMEFPPDLDEFIQKATAKNPDDRYPSVLSLSTKFKQLFISEKQVEVEDDLVVLEPENPYKGLSPFYESDVDDFFGRDALIKSLLNRLDPREFGIDDLSKEPSHNRCPQFLAVIGPSGSGKSSVIQAGLIPAIRKGALPGSENWFFVSMHPDASPFDELENALLSISVSTHRHLQDEIRSNKGGLGRAIRRCLPDPKSRLFLFIDQFEELFSLVDDKEEISNFINCLYSAIVANNSPLHLIIALRADFYDRPLQFPEFGELVRQNQETVLPLSASELNQAINSPAAKVGVHFEPGLESKIVSHVQNQPGALPLLQYALRELFENRERNQLTLTAYNKIGGVLGALGCRAEEIYSKLDEEDQEFVRQLFMRLVTLGDGVEDSRRRVLLSELETMSWGRSPSDRYGKTASRKRMHEVIEIFGHNRLLTFDHDPVTRAPTVEIAHEALLHEWNRLGLWLNTNREMLRMHLQLSAAASEWLSSDYQKDYLLYGSRLTAFEDLWSQSELSLSSLERGYLEASLKEHYERKSKEENRLKKERELERRWRWILIALVAVMTIATIGGLGLAFTARRQANIAFSRELAASALENLIVDPERSILLSLHALGIAEIREAENSLHQAVQNSRVRQTLIGHQGPAYNAAFSPDGLKLATTGQDTTVKIWDLNTGSEIRTLIGHQDEVFGVDFSPDGKHLATTGHDGYVIIWDLESGEEIHRIFAHENKAVSVYFSPDGKSLVSNGLYDSIIKILDADTGEKRVEFTASEEPTWHVTYNPEGTLLATASMDGNVRLWDAGSGELLQMFEIGGVISRVSFSPDGDRLAAANEFGTVSLWDVNSGEELYNILAHKDLVIWTTFSPDGTRLATASIDGIAKIWDAASGKELITLVGHTAPLFGLDFSPDGKMIATGSYDGTTRVWEIGPKKELFTIGSHSDYVYSIDFSPDGSGFVSGSYDGTAIDWELAGFLQHPYPEGDSAPLQKFVLGKKGDRDAIRSVAYSPDGELLVTTDAYGNATIWNEETGEELVVLSGHAPGTTVDTVWNGVTDCAFNPDGSLLVTSGDDLTINIWDVSNGKKQFSLLGHTQGPDSVPPFEGVVAVVFNPDGDVLASAGADGTVRLWNVNDGSLISLIDAHPNSVVTDIAFAPGGDNLVSSSWDGTAVVWDIVRGESLHKLLGHSGPVMSVGYSPDGSLIATGGDEGITRIWDSQSGREMISLTGHDAGILDVDFSPDGKYLATSSQDGTVRFYVISLPELIELAQSRLTRALNDFECQQYLHLDECP